MTDATTFRPRNGASAEAYWRIRRWCEKNGFAFSDVLNGIFLPLAYYLENHCTIDHKRSMATVELNAGFVDILHVFGGKSYPLTSLTTRPALTLEKIEEKINYWKERNKSTPESYDILLLGTNPHAQAKLQARRKAAAANR